LIGHLAIWWTPLPPEALPLRPDQMPPFPIVAAGFVQAALRVFQFLALTGAARLACGLSIPMSFVVVGIPLVLQIVVLPTVAVGLERVLPAVPGER
jgi:hypothetical protein